MSDDVGSMDCPDCQLQLLQQAQSQIPPSSSPPQPSSSGNPSNVIRHENSLVGGRLGEIGFPLMPKSTPYSQVESSNHPYQLPTIHQNIRAPSSSGGLNVYHYGSDYGSSSNPSPSLHQATFSNNPSTSSVPPGTDLNYTSSAMEPCDYHGYCSTCAVLDLPGNNYSRPPNPRPHVFPPIFYSQGPSPVIPGFSSLGDWPNGEYYYSAKYSQTASSASVGPSMASDVYGHSSSTPNHHSNSQHGPSVSNHHVPSSSSFDIFSSNNATSSMLQSSYSNQRQHMQTPSSSMFTTNGGGSGTNTSRPTDYSSHPHFSHHIVTSSIAASSQYASETISSNQTSHVIRSSTNNEKTSDQEEVLTSVDCSKASSPIPRTAIPSAPSDDHRSQQQSSDSESSCDSDRGDGSSMASEDRELISVVEEDDDDEDEMESTKGVRAGGKCVICHNPIEMDCWSPQLAKILENMEDDISVDDLDISGDIEIGGIEDYQGCKKRNASGGQASGILSTSRLVMLLGLSKNLFGPEVGSSGGIDNHDFAILCFRCGKLASIAVALERQLTSTIQTLQQQLIPNNLMQISSRPPRLNLAIDKSVPLEDCHHHSVPSISPTLQFHHIRPVNHKGIQTEWESRSWGTQMSSTFSPISPNPESFDTGTQCCSNDFPETQETFSNPSSSTSSIPYPTNEESSSSSADSQSDSEETHLSKNDATISKISCSDKKQVVGTPLCPSFDTNVCCSSSKRILPQDLLQEEHTHSIAINEKLTPPTSNNFITHSPDGAMDFTKNNSDTMTLESIQNQISLPNICQSCQKVFSTKSNLRAHKKICKAGLHHDETALKMKCSKCGVGFRNVLRHRAHIEEGCKALNLKCDHCPKKFSKLSELKTHLNSHKREKPFSCEKCGASFATKGNQMAHSKTHLDNKRWFCCHCDKGFNRRFALSVHLNRHNDIKPFFCNMCNKSFPDPSYLTKHKKKAHALEIAT